MHLKRPSCPCKRLAEPCWGYSWPSASWPLASPLRRPGQDYRINWFRQVINRAGQMRQLLRQSNNVSRPNYCRLSHYSLIFSWAYTLRIFFLLIHVFLACHRGLNALSCCRMLQLSLAQLWSLFISSLNTVKYSSNYKITDLFLYASTQLSIWFFIHFYSMQQVLINLLNKIILLLLYY